MSKNIESYSAAESGNFYERRSRWSKLRLAARIPLQLVLD